MPQAKTEVALQFSECCAAETALQHLLFCSAEVIWTKSCAAANEKLHCNIEKAALQESGAFLPLSCGFQAPTFRHPRLGPAELLLQPWNRTLLDSESPLLTSLRFALLLILIDRWQRRTTLEGSEEPLKGKLQDAQNYITWIGAKPKGDDKKGTAEDLRSDLS